MQLLPSILLLDGVDLFLQEFKGREENSIHGTGSAHGHAKPPVHMPSEELDLHTGHCLTPGVHQTITLVNALCGIDWICKSSLDAFLRMGGFSLGYSQIIAQDTIPQSPPATRTAKGFEWVPSPPKVVKSCLLLSYVIK